MLTSTEVAPAHQAGSSVDTSLAHVDETTISPEKTFSHTEVLRGNADDVWEACKHGVAFLPDLAAEYFTKAEYERGWGEPGSISVFHFASALPGARKVKQHVDVVDDNSRTLAYTVIEGDISSYSSFKVELKFIPAGESETEAIWTVKYVPVGEAGPPESIRDIVAITLKAFEKAVTEKRIVRHTRTLEAPADTIWNILMHEDVILPKVIPHIIESYEFLEGNGEAGSIRLLKLGHAIPNGKNVVEHIDVNDAATKRWGYTVLQGDPKYKYLSAVMQFLPGSEEGTTLAKWVGAYVPHNPTITPPDLALHVWKVFEGVAKASPQAVY